MKKKKVRSNKEKVAQVKNIGCRSKTILMANVTPRGHRNILSVKCLFGINYVLHFTDYSFHYLLEKSFERRLVKIKILLQYFGTNGLFYFLYG